MIDFALERRRHEHLSAEEAIYEAAVLRFRPIMMTTMAAIFGLLPIAAGFGAGAALRQPLGVAVVAGLVVSQALTLFTIPVTYIYMDRLSDWLTRLAVWRRRGKTPRAAGSRSDHALVPAGHHAPPAIPVRGAAQ
jgi:predicted RND superfamily exporter protein